MSNEDSSFANAVSKHCKEKKTGTILISTKNNKACQVVINSGQIAAVIMGRLKGLEAVLEAKKVGVKAESFNNRQLPFTDDAKINSSDELMKLLVVTEVVSTDSKVTEIPANSKYDEVMEFLKTDALDDDAADIKSLSDLEKASTDKKPKRMYRGQPLD